MKFWVSLCRKFPWIVQEIIIAKNCGYQPLRLSGIVTNDTQGATSAELPVVLKLRMPYLLHDSTSTYLQIALGSCVSVNFLLGIPFLKNAKATLSFETNKLVCANLLGSHSFDVSYRPPRLDTNLPTSPTGAAAIQRERFSSIQDELTEIMAHFASDAIGGSHGKRMRVQFMDAHDATDSGYYGPPRSIHNPSYLGGTVPDVRGTAVVRTGTSADAPPEVPPQGLSARLAHAGGWSTVDPSDPSIPHFDTGLVPPSGDLSEIGLVPAPALATALHTAAEVDSARNDSASVPEMGSGAP
jgi:hypothetical protein